MPRGRLCGALHNRNFRYLWFATTAASLAQRIDSVVVGWLVLELTNSAFMVGLVGSMRFLGALLGPVTGVMADRWDRRRLQMLALLVMTSLMAALLGLAVMQRLEAWSLLLATTLGGMVWAFIQPAQQSMPADFLSGRDLVNGIALLNTAMNLTAMLGPALGGVLLACCGADVAAGAPGVQWAYGVLLLLYLVQVGHYWAIDFEPRAPRAALPSLWQHLITGLRYSCGEAGLWTPLALAGLVNFVAFPSQFTLLPIFAREVFQVGAAGLGLLGTALGVGAVLGSVLLAWRGAMHHAGRLMLWGTLGWFGLLGVFASTSAYTVALGVLVLMGIAQTYALTNMTVLLLGTARHDMRGCIMGLRALAVAPLVLGGTLAGAATASLGAPLTTLGCALLGLLLTGAIAPWIPRHVTS